MTYKLSIRATKFWAHSNRQHLINGFVFAAIITTVLVNLIRITSISENYLWAQTSGLEGSGLFGAFQVCTGGHLYHPYETETVGYLFNYLFYLIYGFVVFFFGNCEFFTPLITHYVSFSITLGFSTLIFFQTKAVPSVIQRLFFSTLPFSAVVGWWSLAVRPDIGAAVFSAAGIYFLFRYLKNNSRFDYFTAVFLLILAGGFKQTIYALYPPIFFIMSYFNWKAAIEFLAYLILLILFPFLYYGNFYFEHAFLISSSHSFFVNLAITNLSLFLLKGGIIAAFAIYVLFGQATADQSIRRIEGVFYLYLLSIFALFSAKIGAGDYYFLPLFFLSILVISKFWMELKVHVRSPAILIMSAIICLGNSIILFKIQGSMNVNVSHKK